MRNAEKVTMLREEDWLPHAKRLAVGMRTRVRHGRERRPNLVVGNESGRWWAYCQSCKEGAALDKEHVLLRGAPAPDPINPEVPKDLRPAVGSDMEDSVGAFLARKGMMFPYLPKLWVSVSEQRLCLQDSSGGWHGRDITERRHAKWLHYSKPHIVGEIGDCTVVTEDLFSMYKVAFAMRGTDVAVCSTLGAGCSQSAALALKNCKKIVWAYDGDRAGDAGYASASKRMRAFGSRQYRARPPEGLDPKDMDCASIRAMLKNTLDGG